MWIVAAGDDQSVRRDQPGEVAEALDDLVDVLVAIEMIFFDVGDDGDLGMQVVEAAVEFARLGDEDVARRRNGCRRRAAGRCRR